MTTSQSILKGSSSKAFASISEFLSKASSTNKYRLYWHSDILTSALGSASPEKSLYLKTKQTSLSRQEIMKAVSKQISCNFELRENHIHIYPSQGNEETKILFQDLMIATIGTIGIGNFGKPNLLGKIKSENIIVEFGSPNIAKPLHMGHLRSTVTGHYIARMSEYAGHNVTSMCFLGDWGTQFGVLQAGLKKWMDTNSVEESVQKLDIRSLLHYYIRSAKEREVNENFAKESKKFSLALENSNPSALKIWSTIREKTLEHLKETWEQFDITYDVIQGESEFAMKSNHTEKALCLLRDKGVLTSDPDGCVYATVPSNAKDGTMVKVPIVKADGSSLYLLRDIGAAKSRSEEFQFDRMIYVVDKAQTYHFCNLIHLLKNFGFETSASGNRNSRRAQHVSFGKIEGMSTRSGTFVLLSDALHDGAEMMEEARKQSPNTRREELDDKKVSFQLATSALVVYCLKSKRNRDFRFHWTDAIKPIGETGIKLQYTHARIRSLEEKQNFDAEILTNIENFSRKFDIDYILSDMVALDLSLHLINFEDSFWASYHEFEPCILLTYLFKLCDKISKALKELPIKTETDPGIAETRLILFALSRQILSMGMNIIGIKPLDQI